VYNFSFDINIIFYLYHMLIKIDNREQELIAEIQQVLSLFDTKEILLNEATLHHEGAKLLLKVEMLPLGDIIISDDEGNDLIIIERKSINDLIASIKDGRYEEQSYRLSGSPIHNHNIIYLIEGGIHTAKKHNHHMVYSAIFSLNHYKGFSVIRSMNMQESAIFIVNSAKKIMTNTRLNKSPHYSSQVCIASFVGDGEVATHDVNTEKIPYSSVVKKVKKDNITAENMGEIMLSQMPGLSHVTAGAIMTHFGGSFQTLVMKIKESPDCLKEVTYLNAKNQPKHLNKTIIENIVKFLSK